jgi:hypothetical protein
MGCAFACISLLVLASCVEIFVPYFLQTLHGFAPLGRAMRRRPWPVAGAWVRWRFRAQWRRRPA